MNAGEALERSVGELVSGKDVAVAFSGGLDSGIVAYLCAKYADSVMLYVAGSEDSHDVMGAEYAAEMLGLPLKKILFGKDDVLGIVENMMRITGTSEPLTLMFEIPAFMVCKHCSEDYVIGGQGADEVFGGYSKYLGLSYDEYCGMRSADLLKLRGPTMEHERKTATHFGKTMLYPFLDEAVLKSARSAMPKGELRKEILREAAAEMGLLFLADKPKKAAQYGSGAAEMLRDVCGKKGFSEAVGKMAEGMNLKRSG